MTNKLICEFANIDYYPNLLSINEGNQIAIGDLHGNALKFLHFLVKHEVVECSPESYNLFVEIYRKETDELTELDLHQIKTICNELTIKNKAKICLIGDELADRGQNDYFTLLLINKLQKESVCIDILLSNHGFSFITCLENGGYFRSDFACGDRRFARSMHQMQDLIDDEKLTVDEIRTLAKSSYLPNLKLLSYTITCDNEITYYSHAKIDEEVIVNLARMMGVPYVASTVFEFAATIDAINESFQKNYVQTRLVHSLPRDFSVISKNDPITFLIWNRDYHILNKNPHSYKINEVHGHDSNGPISEGVYCLNNTLGLQLFCHHGEYMVLISSLAYHTKNQLSDNSALTVLEPAQVEDDTSLVNYFFSNLFFSSNEKSNEQTALGWLNPFGFFSNRLTCSVLVHSSNNETQNELDI